MTALTVWKFDTPGGAEQAFRVLTDLQSQELIAIEDASWVSWEAGKKRPKTHQTGATTTAGAAFGSFWGLLFGLLFFVPILGVAVGGALGAMSGSLAHFGIDKDFIDKVRDEVTPGTSALFLLSDGAVIDRVQERFVGTHAELIRSNLSDEQEAKLRDAFAEQ